MLKSYQDIREADVVEMMDNAISAIMDVCEYDKQLVSEVLHCEITAKKVEYWKLRFANKSLEELLYIKDLLASDKLCKKANELAKESGLYEAEKREEVPSVEKQESLPKGKGGARGKRKSVK